MNALRQMLLGVRERLDGEGDVEYLKAAQLGSECGLGARRAGIRMAYIRESDSVPVEATRWSKTSRATTYKVSVEDWGAFQEYLTELRGRPEPTLTVSSE